MSSSLFEIGRVTSLVPATLFVEESLICFVTALCVFADFRFLALFLYILIPSFNINFYFTVVEISCAIACPGDERYIPIGTLASVDEAACIEIGLNSLIQSSDTCSFAPPLIIFF